MQAFYGYYDGRDIKPLEPITAKPNQRVIITVMDDFVESENTDSSDILGLLSEYADPARINMEKTAWENAAVNKHGYT